MKKLLFIYPSFHEKTGSNDFIRTLLEERYYVDYCALEWADESLLLNYIDKKYDFIVCWQLRLSKKILSSLEYDRGVFFPMLDACKPAYKIEWWWNYRRFKIISFSSFLHKKLKIVGLDSHYIQYFPPINNEVQLGSPRSAFFWNRRSNPNINDIMKLLSESDIKAIHWHNAQDPDQEILPISNQYNHEYFINTSSWFEDKEDMEVYRNNSSYYFAPRESEGIGHSFLEAMACGRCVIAPNNGTMNEYIEHGENGLLYDSKKIKPIGLHDLESIQNNVLQYCREGRKRWDESKSLIYNWMEDAGRVNTVRLYFWLLIRLLRNPKNLMRLFN